MVMEECKEEEPQMIGDCLFDIYGRGRGLSWGAGLCEGAFVRKAIWAFTRKTGPMGIASWYAFDKDGKFKGTKLLKAKSLIKAERKEVALDVEGSNSL